MRLLADIKKNVNIDIRELNDKERDFIIKSIKEKYTSNIYSDLFLWEYFEDYLSVQDENGWKYIEQFVGNNKCIVFFNKSQEKAFIELNSGRDLNEMIGEMYGFEFYVTDKDSSYLICFSEHDILYGLGKAKNYINKLKQNGEKNE